MPYGTDASELQAIAPCVVLGPGTIETAHTPRECVPLADLAAAVPLFGRILAGGGIIRATTNVRRGGLTERHPASMRAAGERPHIPAGRADEAGAQ